MKIVQVLTRGDVLGGAQSHVLDLSIALQERGHDVIVVTGRRGIFNQRLDQAGICTMQISTLVRPIRPHRDIQALAELHTLLRHVRPDVVCAHTAKAGWLARSAAKLLGIPSVFTPHGWSMVDRSSLKPRYNYLWAERLAGSMGTRTINVCDYERNLAKSHRISAPDLLDVVHNGIPDIPAERAQPVALQPPTLVMVARYEEQKDHATLLRALAGLKALDWRLALVGEGEREAEVQGLVSSLGLWGRVDMLPGNTNVARLLHESQLFVLSTNFEAFPISILEAMRAGLPVVSTRVGGVPEAVIDGNTGLLVPRSDADTLQRTLRRLIQDPASRTELGAAGRERYLRHFTSDIMVTQTLRVYDRALRAGTQKAALSLMETP